MRFFFFFSFTYVSLILEFCWGLVFFFFLVFNEVKLESCKTNKWNEKCDHVITQLFLCYNLKTSSQSRNMFSIIFSKINDCVNDKWFWLRVTVFILNDQWENV